MARGNRGSQLLPPRASSKERGKASTSRGSSLSSSVHPPGGEPSDTFRQERLENEARRTERGSHQASRARGTGRGTPRGSLISKPLRNHEKTVNPTNKLRNLGASNTSTSNPAIAMAGNQSNPFAPSSVNPMISSTSSANTAFSASGAKSQAIPPITGFGATRSQFPFGAPSQPSSSSTGSAPPASNPFAASNAFAAAKPAAAIPLASKPANPFATTAAVPFSSSAGLPQVQPAQSNPFSNAATTFLNKSSSTSFGTSDTSIKPALDPTAARKVRFGTNSSQGSPVSNTQPRNRSKPAAKFQATQIAKSAFQSTDPKPISPPDPSDRSSEAMAKKVEAVIRSERIIAPEWLGWDMEDSRPASTRPELTKYFLEYKEYQAAVRLALMKAKLIDDPDKPKKLSEAIDFKGTCEEMCHQLEKADRMQQGEIYKSEKGIAPNGSEYPVLEKMVKKLARASAGQVAPLPEDVRSTAALRRTVNYLLGTVLTNDNLPDVYSWLWDRTRAVRRDFVFHSFMSEKELYDQIYCLEKIVRFHITALHHLSQDGVIAPGFVEQQEIEQLGKAFRTLIDTYEACGTQDMLCDNEIEFKAYYILWCARSNPGVLEEAQSWGVKVWKHEQIQLAVSLTEALQNPWDALPIKPLAETDIASNAFSRFFYVIESKEVSYTMACLAESFFNHVRISILKALVKSYRRQKQQSTAWTVPELNKLLRFDSENEVIPFCESHGVNFDTTSEGDEYLSFMNTHQITHPLTPLKQGYSYNIVEKKRGHYSLTDVINRAVYDESSDDLTISMQDNESEDDECSLFVKDNSAKPFKTTTPIETHIENNGWTPSVPVVSDENILPTPTSAAKSVSVFDNIQAPKISADFFAKSSPFAPTTSSQPLAKPSSPFFPQQSSSGSLSMFGTQSETQALPVSTVSEPTIAEISKKPTSPFSFLQPAAASQTPPVNNNQASEVATPFGLFNPPTFSQDPPPAASFMPKMQPQKDKPAAPLNMQSSVLQAPSVPFTGFAIPPAVPNHSPDSEMAPAVKITPAAIEPNQNELRTTSISAVPPDQRSEKLTAVSKWVALGEGGLLQQFIESQVELILHDAAKTYMKEEAIKSAREADERAVIEADDFRSYTLASRYGRKWRENVRVLALKRRGRVARQARREFAESMRASKAAKSASLVEDFRASTTSKAAKSTSRAFTTSRRRGSLASLLDDTGVLDLVHNPNNEIDSIVNGIEPSPKRHRSERSTASVTSSTRERRRGESGQQDPLRRSLMSDPTYLQGGSRIHLISDSPVRKQFRPQLNGVATDYFRLKARGISTLPDGTPLATSVTSNPAPRKRSSDVFVRPETPRQVRVAADAQSVPTKSSRGPVHSHAEMQALKTKAKSIMADDQLSRHQKRAFVDDDEELFERAKRVREQMDEGADWYRQEMQRETASRSMS